MFVGAPAPYRYIRLEPGNLQVLRCSPQPMLQGEHKGPGHCQSFHQLQALIGRDMSRFRSVAHSAEYSEKKHTHTHIYQVSVCISKICHIYVHTCCINIDTTTSQPTLVFHGHQLQSVRPALGQHPRRGERGKPCLLLRIC